MQFRDEIIRFSIPMPIAYSIRCPNAESLQNEPLRTPYKKQPPTTVFHNIKSCLLLSSLHDLALITTSWLVGVLLLLDLPDHELESFGDILVVPGACFRVGTVELLS